MPAYTLVGHTGITEVEEGLVMNEGLDLLEGDRLFLVSPNAVLEDGMVSQNWSGERGRVLQKC